MSKKAERMFNRKFEECKSIADENKKFAEKMCGIVMAYIACMRDFNLINDGEWYGMACKVNREFRGE